MRFFSQLFMGLFIQFMVTFAGVIVVEIIESRIGVETKYGPEWEYYNRGIMIAIGVGALANYAYYRYSEGGSSKGSNSTESISSSTQSEDHDTENIDQKAIPAGSTKGVPVEKTTDAQPKKLTPELPPRKRIPHFRMEVMPEEGWQHDGTKLRVPKPTWLSDYDEIPLSQFYTFNLAELEIAMKARVLYDEIASEESIIALGVQAHHYFGAYPEELCVFADHVHLKVIGPTGSEILHVDREFQPLIPEMHSMSMKAFINWVSDRQAEWNPHKKLHMVTGETLIQGSYPEYLWLVEIYELWLWLSMLTFFNDHFSLECIEQISDVLINDAYIREVRLSKVEPSDHFPVRGWNDDLNVNRQFIEQIKEVYDRAWQRTGQ